MNSVIYKITYLPFINTSYPKYYVGSKYRYKPGYYGSLASKQIFTFTNGIPLRKWWKEEVRRDPSNFVVEILEQFDDISTSELVERELYWQRLLDIKSDDYFNQSFANGKFVSKSKGQSTKIAISESTRKYWNTEEGQAKKDRLAARNSITKGQELKNRWNDLKFVEAFRKYGCKPKSDLTKKKMSAAAKTLIEYKGVNYLGYKELQEKTGVSRHLYHKYYLRGYDPEVNINNKHPKEVML